MLDSENKQSLPHGAKGVDLGQAVIVVARDKLVLSSKNAQHHFTLHFGTNSQIMDIHRKCTAADGSVSYNTLFSISHDNLKLLLQEIGLPIMNALRGVLRPLGPGWMARRHVGAVVGLVPVESSEIQHVTRLRHKKLVIDQDKIASRAKIPEFLEDLYELPDGETFTLISCKNATRQKMIGVGFKFTTPAGQPRLVWFNNRRLFDEIERLGALFQDGAARYGTFHVPLPWD